MLCYYIENCSLFELSTFFCSFQSISVRFLLRSSVFFRLRFKVWYGKFCGIPINTKPDFTYSVSVLSTYCENIRKFCCDPLQRKLRYDIIRAFWEIVFRKYLADNSMGYSIWHFTRLVNSKKLIEAYIFSLAVASILSFPKLQLIVNLLSTKAKYMALVKTLTKKIECLLFFNEWHYCKTISMLICAKN